MCQAAGGSGAAQPRPRSCGGRSRPTPRRSRTPRFQPRGSAPSTPLRSASNTAATTESRQKQASGKQHYR
eukprot:7889399-Alexandrium_andersonii.AAC.1